MNQPKQFGPVVEHAPGPPVRGPLALGQHALLQVLFARPTTPGVGLTPNAADRTENTINTIAETPYFTGAKGLKAYKNNGFALAERALGSAFPVLEQLLGEDSFKLMARDFWCAHPPERGDLAQWGGALGEFVQVNPHLADEPYLGDVARVEWALHQCGLAPDQEAHPQSFALLSSAEPESIFLLLASGANVLRSAYPVASIVTAHLHNAPSLQEVGQKLRAGQSENALVWRQGLKPRVTPCTDAEADFLLALLGGLSLLDALEAAPDLDLNDWLAKAVQSGLALGVKAPL